MKTLYTVVMTLLLVSPICGRAIQTVAKPDAPLWGDLSPGPYTVGFRTIYQIDRSRTWATTRRFQQSFVADLGGRPIRVSVWYPAIRDRRARQMRFKDYVDPVGSPAELSNIINVRETENISRVPPGRWSDLMATPVNAYFEAAAARGRFPLLLYAGGLNSTSTTYVFVMAEFLASHGYIVATVPLLGPSNENTEQGRTPADRERSIQDLEFAWSLMRGQSNVDETRFGVFGKSLGGLEALIFAMRNANVLAVIGLDATYGFKGNQKLLTDLADYSPRKMRAAFLDLRRDWDDPEKVLDLSAEHSLHYSDRTFITVKRMHHRDFDSDAMIGFTFHLPIGPNEMDSYQSGWTRETGYRGHQNVCQIVLDYFDEKVKGDPRGAERLITDIARADGAVLKQEDALVPPPSAVEFSRLITRQGFDAATAIVDRYRRQIPDDPVIEADVFNDYGYRLIAEHRLTEAIEMLRLIVYAYPDSAAAADGLADAYIAAKQNDLARAALHQALKLIPADPRLNEANKQWLAQGEQAKLDQLRP